MTQQTINIDPTMGMTPAQLAELNKGMAEQERTHEAYKVLDGNLTEALDTLAYDLRDRIESLIKDRATNLAFVARSGGTDRPLTDQRYREAVRDVVDDFLTAFTVENVNEMGKARLDWDRGSQRFLSALSRRSGK